ncbi:MAG TPA: hypothetical protein VGM39_22515 [Kofleriaceae bacterium]|jgi:hypothetical protein
MRWLVGLMVLVGCASNTPKRHAPTVKALDRHYWRTKPLPPESTPDEMRLFDEIGEYALFRVTQADGSRAFEKLELVGFDACGTWVTSELTTKDGIEKRYVCFMRSQYRGASEELARVYYQRDGGVIVKRSYARARDKKKEVGSIADRFLFPSRTNIGTGPDGSHYELVERGKDKWPRSELGFLASRVEAEGVGTTEERASYLRLVSIAASGALGLTAPHADADTRSVAGIGLEAYIRLTPTLDVVSLVHADQEDYQRRGSNETRGRTFLGYGVRWSPNLADPRSSWRGLFVRSTIGFASFSDSFRQDVPRGGYGIETAIGLRVFSHHAESAVSAELAHQVSVFPDDGVQHTLMLRLGIEIGHLWP